MSCTVEELTRRLGGELDGPGSVELTSAAPLGEAREDQVSFLANQRYVQQMAETRAGAVIVGKDYTGPGGPLIRCDDPYFAYRQAMVLLHGWREHPITGVDERAAIDPAADIATGVRVGPFATICAGASVGEGTVIYPGVFVGPGVRVGRDCLLYPNVCLYDDTQLGDRVAVHANSTIGQDGFGYATAPDEAGVVCHQKIPPVGRVVLEDDVEIGSNCAIERATMGDTVIGAGTKFADLVAIGHGTKLGKHCLMVSQAGIAGSTIVGDYCAFAGQAGVVGHIRIGDGCRVGAQAGVTNDVPAGAEVLGSPAIPRAEARKVVMATKRMPELRSVVKTLTRELAALKARVEELTDKPSE